MSVAALQPLPPVSDRVNEIAAAIAARCAKSGAPPSVEVTEADLSALSPDERAFVLRVGLVSIVNDTAHRGRFPEEDAAEETAGNSRRTRVPFHAAYGRNPTSWRALGILLCGAEGRMKPLVQFTRADIDSLLANTQSQAKAWSARAKWCRSALRALGSSDGPLSSLPTKTLQVIDEEACNAWGR